MLFLNALEKQYIRERFEEMLFLKNPKQKIYIPQELLEELLFDKHYMGNGTVVKFIAWTGSFLQNIDLHEISFEDVCWYYPIKEYIEKEKNFSKTNAQIDFSKSYDYKKFQKVTLYNYDFSFLDFTNSHIECITLLENVKCISGKIQPQVIQKLQVNHCDLRGLNLQTVHINSLAFLPYLDANAITFYDTNLSYSGIHIIHNPFFKDIKKIQKEYYFYKRKLDLTLQEKERMTQLSALLNQYQHIEEAFKRIRNLQEQNKLNECYVNEELIKNPNEKKLNLEYLKIPL